MLICKRNMNYVAHNRSFKYEILNMNYNKKKYLSHFLENTLNFFNVMVGIKLIMVLP